MLCPHCHKAINPALISKAAGQLHRAAMTTPPRQKLLKPCPFCGHAKGVRELRQHRPLCPQNPRNRKKP